LSVEAITWAFAQPIKHSSEKFVLIALANCANAAWECWPSVVHLCELTGQNRKTVMANLHKLAALGLIETTGETVGRTGRVQVYRLVTVPKAAPLNEAKNGTIATELIVPKTDSNSPENGRKQYQKRTETVPKTGPGTVRNRKEPVDAQKRGSRLAQDWGPDPELMAWAVAARTDLYIPAVVEQFRDYWLGVPGQKGCKLDWPATFRNWVRNQRQQQRPGNNQQRFLPV
jgi:hypothetical protein